MKTADEMTTTELIEEIQYLASILDDQPFHAGYLADLCETLAARVAAEM